MNGKLPSSDQENEKLKRCILDNAVEAWRLEYVLLKIMRNMDAKDQTRFIGKIRWFMKKNTEALEAAGFSMVNYENMAYEPGIPATPINIDDFSDGDELFISQMVEPVIVDRDGTVAHTGTVLLQKR